MIALPRDPRLGVRIVGRRVLAYSDGADARMDRPLHVRAASGVLRVGRRHLIVQDDALFVGIVSDAVTSVALPSPDGVRQFGSARGNKARKPDLEAVCGWSSGSRVLAFGSGSTSARERVLVAPVGPDGRIGTPALREAPGLYASVRGALPPCETNLEGAWPTPDGHLRLLQRGNGAGGVNACIELDGSGLDAWIAGGDEGFVVRSVLHAGLGELDHTALSFTDGFASAGGWWFAASAEASPNAVDDGEVAGSAVGWCDDRQGAWAPITDADGRIVRCKLEGVAPGSAPDRLVGVVDPDDPARPSELLDLALIGPWPAA